MLLGDDDSSACEAEVDDSGLCAESAAADKGLLDSLETAIDSTTPAPPNSDMWHDIDDLLETAECLRHSEPKPSTSDSMRHHTLLFLCLERAIARPHQCSRPMYGLR